jgi:hypothetical protein
MNKNGKKRLFNTEDLVLQYGHQNKNRLRVPQKKTPTMDKYLLMPLDEGFCLKQTDALEIASNHATECGFDDSVAEERDPVLDAYDYIRTFNEIASTHEEHCAESG